MLNGNGAKTLLDVMANPHRCPAAIHGRFSTAQRAEPRRRIDIAGRAGARQSRFAIAAARAATRVTVVRGSRFGVIACIRAASTMHE